MFALLLDPALAAPRGVVVRLDGTGSGVESPVTAVLTTKDGTKNEVVLNDDGSAGDVAAGDSKWSGAGFIDGDTFDVTLNVGGKTLDGGAISWSPDDELRDLEITLAGGVVTLNASVASGAGGAAPSGGAPQDVASAPTGAATTGGATPPTAGGALPGGGRTSPVSFPTGNTSQPGLYIGLGVGLLLLVGIAALWMRTRRPDAPDRVGGLLVQPEPGLLGEGTPSLSDGLSLWLAEPADTQDLAKALLATLARHHRVLLVGPATMTPPPVHGGPVYRGTGSRPSHVGDAVDALLGEGDRPVAVFIAATAEEASAAKEYADALPAAVGGVVLVSSPVDVALPIVRCSREGDVWTFQGAGVAVRARLDFDGLWPVEARAE